jgi:7,8-dihydropterin-6-yl-methyl-4-(beta-D-ribofuranosyl)aminobenzene 5'-phosphate synthase
MDKCTILIENTNSELLSAKVEHGLSLLIEAQNKRFLFDFGSTDKFLFNASLMNKNLDNLDFVSISHSHYDHSSGFLSFVKNHSVNEIIIGDNFFLPKYALNNDVLTYLGCGFDRAFIEKENIKITEVTNLYEITDNMYFMNNFKPHYSFETIPERFVHGEEDALLKDNFFDEMSIVIDNNGELTFITGCAHAGILSMIAQVNEKFEGKVTRVIGGAHLNIADEKRLKRTADELVKLGVKETFFCHCSGDRITEVLKDATSIIAHKVSTGDIIKL